jgi:hypothetical protein
MSEQHFQPLAALWDRAVTPVLLDLIETARITGLEVPKAITFKATVDDGRVVLTLIEPHREP